MSDLNLAELGMLEKPKTAPAKKSTGKKSTAKKSTAKPAGKPASKPAKTAGKRGGRKKINTTTKWEIKQRKVNGISRAVKVRHFKDKATGKVVEQVRVIKEHKKQPLTEPMPVVEYEIDPKTKKPVVDEKTGLAKIKSNPSGVKIGDKVTRTHIVRGRVQDTTLEFTGKPGFMKWKITGSKFKPIETAKPVTQPPAPAGKKGKKK